MKKLTDLITCPNLCMLITTTQCSLQFQKILPSFCKFLKKITVPLLTCTEFYLSLWVCFSIKTSMSALLAMPKPLTVWITINWKILKEMGIPDHLTCFLRNLYTGQEATVRTGHGTTDWFQIGKGVCQGCILSPCLFNLYVEYIM